MATIAEFTVPADAFPLGRIFERLPDVTVELERIIPTNHALFPYFWVQGASVDRVVEAIEDHPGLESLTVVDGLEDHGLFRAKWDEDIKGIVTGIAETETVLLSAVGTRDEWVFELRAENTDQLSAFQRYCRDNDVSVTLTRIHSLAEIQTGGEYDLTPEQHEALVLAFDEGYYDDPRRTDLEALASKLDISRPAFADRLRRGYRNLVGSTVAHHRSKNE